MKWSDSPQKKVRFQAVSKKRLRIFLDGEAKSLRKIRKNEVGGNEILKLLKVTIDNMWQGLP